MHVGQVARRLRTTVTDLEGTIVLDGTALVYREPSGRKTGQP